MPLARWYYNSAFQARLAKFFGRRGTFLVLDGIIWVVIGFAIFAQPQERFSRPGPGGGLEVMELPAWGLFWALCGLVAIVTAFLRRAPGRHRLDQWGFTALMGPALLWCFAFVWSWLSNLANPSNGRPTSWLGALVYLVIILSVLVVAGWPDPADESDGGGL